MTSLTTTSILFHNSPIPTERPPEGLYLPDARESRLSAPGSGDRVVVTLNAKWPNGRANIQGCGITTAEVILPATEVRVGDKRYAHHRTGPKIKVHRKDDWGTDETTLSQAQAAGLLAYLEREILPCRNLGKSAEDALHVDGNALLAHVREAIRSVTDLHPNQQSPKVEPLGITSPVGIPVGIATRRFEMAGR